MGTDINGWIEYKDVDNLDEWYPAISLDVVYPVGRDYSAFGYLFGVRKVFTQLVAAKRGIPEDASTQIRSAATHSTGFYAHSWITWQELKSSGWQYSIYWEPTMKVFEILAHLYGDENVRLVVWFED